jgi:hypothetical protein
MEVFSMAEQQGSLTRIAAYSALVFFGLFVLGFIVYNLNSTPFYDVPGEEWVAWYDDAGKSTPYLLGGLIMTLGAIALVAFAASSSELLRIRSTRAFVAPLILALGTVVGVFVIAGNLVSVSVAAALTFAPDYAIPGVDLLQTVEQMGFVLWLIGGGWTSALFVALFSYAARGTDLLPRWLVTGGFVVAGLLILSPAFIPFMLLPIWGLAVGIYLLSAKRQGLQPLASPAVPGA